MEVRQTSSAGKLLYSGTLEQGQRKSFDGKSAPARARRAAERARPAERESRRPSERLDVRRDLAADPPGDILSRPRAAIVVTGSELVRGERHDRNGPFLAAEVAPARPRAGADRDRRRRRRRARGRAPRGAARPTSASSPAGSGRRTTTARSSSSRAPPGGRSCVDEELEAEIGGVSRTIAERLGRPYADFAAGRAQAGDAARGRRRRSGSPARRPGSCSTPATASSSCCPGPPRELQRLWPRALETEPVRRVLARARRPRAPRAALLRRERVGRRARRSPTAGGDGDGVEVTICARDFEIHVDLVRRAGRGGARRDALPSALARAARARTSSREDERPVEEIVLELCRARGLTLATAESCTGGLVAARLTAVPGASDVFLGGVVAYANEVKDARARRARRACSQSTAPSRPRPRRRWRAGARERLGADVGVAVTGIAGPGGGTPEKPVGLVYLHADGPDGEQGGATFELPGDRESIRARATVAALHLVRRFLAQSRHDSRVTPPASVGGDERLRLFLALELPDDVARRARRAGRQRASRAAGRVGPARAPARHARVPRAAGPRGELERDRRRAAARRLLRDRAVRARAACATARRAASGCSSSHDRGGGATALAERAARAPRGARRLRARSARRWLPHVTVLRFRERPRLAPPLPELGPFAPSDAAALPFRLHPTGAQYEVLGIVFAEEVEIEG